MHQNSLEAIGKGYFKRFGFKKEGIKYQPSPEMKLCVIIPCYDEPDVLLTLNSLKNCHAPQYPIEVILVINAGLQEYNVHVRNRHSYEEVLRWQRVNSPHWLSLYVMLANDLPAKHAGVGLARKIGMDEALRRFVRIKYKGMLVCLDADCTVAPNYLQVLESVHIKEAPASTSIHFEHQYKKINDGRLQIGIIYYELFLRYYANALGYSGYPFSMHTVGSSMTVRADTYALSGGMNRRKAGEDFYFLHKVAPMGKFSNISDTCVYPSARISARVPFGTGKAQQEWLLNPKSRSYTYHIDIFDKLKGFLEMVPSLYSVDVPAIESVLSQLSPSIRDFLIKQEFLTKMVEINTHSNTYNAFSKKFFAWFDGFKVLKFVHFCKDHYYKPMELTKASNLLLQRYGDKILHSPVELLKHYRELDKNRRLSI